MVTEIDAVAQPRKPKSGLASGLVPDKVRQSPNSAHVLSGQKTPAKYIDTASFP
ncbi:hypothetical protein LFAB_06915 [Lactiplantibacillus fabifermentans T30PCM01]|uniref:Uncharacterized protein n=1 Tax=Lactiplantibacillus fabifermentans T30PCM01 TaxID=1400520 RepID=W6T8D4_9LACO|nr:hypothetical protein LFAB_06915 [Lactiplantibacillus fabifermentans T30PCM01]